MKDQELREFYDEMESLGREAKLIDRFIVAIGQAGTYDGTTRPEALNAIRRFAHMTENTAQALGIEDDTE